MPTLTQKHCRAQPPPLPPLPSHLCLPVLPALTPTLLLTPAVTVRLLTCPGSGTGLRPGRRACSAALWACGPGKECSWMNVWVRSKEINQRMCAEVLCGMFGLRLRLTQGGQDRITEKNNMEQ